MRNAANRTDKKDSSLMPVKDKSIPEGRRRTPSHGAGVRSRPDKQRDTGTGFIWLRTETIGGF
jgi:hypothetical protein